MELSLYMFSTQELTQYSTRIQQDSLLTSPTYNKMIFLSSKINENKYK